jgi:hypothetical protein
LRKHELLGVCIHFGFEGVLGFEGFSALCSWAGVHQIEHAFDVGVLHPSRITRAQHTLAVSWARKRKKGRDMVAGVPSRFIAEMGLDDTTVKEDPRAKLRALRAEFAAKAALQAAQDS